MADEDNDKSKYLRRVRNLLELAENAAGTPEGELAMGKAMEMMEQFGLSEAMLDASRAKADKRDKIGKIHIAFGGKAVYAKYDLISNLAWAHDMRFVVHSRGRAKTGVTILGWESDLAMVEMLYTSLLLQSTSALRKDEATKKPAWYSMGETTKWKRTWMLTFSYRINARIKAIRAAAVAERDAQPRPAGGMSAELVLVDRKAALDLAYDEEWGDLKTQAKQKRAYDYDAVKYGSAAAARANLGDGSHLEGAGSAQIGTGR